MNSIEKLATKINNLIIKNNDASKTFQQAAERTSHSLLKGFLTKQSIKREKFAFDISATLLKYDPAFETNEEGSLAGGIYSGWIDMKAAFTNDTDDAILEECLRGDRASLEEYSEVLEASHELPASIAELIQDQYAEIYGAVQSINRFEDLA